MSSLESDIAKAAKAAGADAVILEGAGDEVIGAVGSSFGNVNGTYGNGSYTGYGFCLRFQSCREKSREQVLGREIPS